MWDSLVESGGETLPAPTSPTPSVPVPVGGQKEVDKQMKVVVDLFSKYDFARVKSKRAVYYRPKGEGTFTRLYEEEFLVLVRDSYFSLFGKGEAKKVRDCRDTVQMMIKKQYDDLPDDLVQVSDNIFWDAESGTIEDHPPRPCFRRLFSTRFESKHVRRVAPFTVAQEQKLVARYNQFLQAYERGERPKNFDFVDTWANGDDDVYWDLMRAVAYCFLKKKPVGSYVLIGERRNGKSPLSNDTPVLARRNGVVQWLNHGDLRVGDEVMGWEGVFYEVTHTVPYQAQKMYEVTLQDGRTVKAAEDHLWSVVRESRLTGIGRYDASRFKTMTTAELAESEAKWFLPPSPIVSTPTADLPIDPYVLGVIIGDGNVAPATYKQPGYLQICGEDKQLVGLFNNCKILRYGKSGNPIYVAKTNEYAKQCVALGIAGKKSYEKFIPEQYMVASAEQRMSLLAGLLDTDGTISHAKSNIQNNQVEFSTTSKRLAKQVRSLVFSLGGSATIHTRQGHYVKNGVRVDTRENYRLFIRSTYNPFRLPRKAQHWHLPKRLGYTAVKSVKYVGVEDCQCIAIDSPSHLYLATKDYIPTHNTFVGLLHTIFGTDNTSMVRLSQLGDPHYANRLTNTIMNAPDEEDEKAIDAQATFKGLALDTPILTDCGFKPMGEIKVGDVLYDRNFKPTAVVAKSETHYNPCYKIMFDNFQTVVADHEHRWVVSVDMDLEEVKTTEEIAELFKQGHEVYMPNVSPDPRPSGRTVLCDPYLYGVWLAKNGGSATEGAISGLRRDIRRYLKTRGVESDQKPNFSTPELRQALSMGIATKRILHGDLQTRLDMLRGYMDVLGFGSKDSYEVYARLDDKTLLPILQQLISSLGWATRVGLDRATRHSALFFTPNKQVFAVKQKLWLPMDRFDSRHRRVIEITPVKTVPTQCVQVSSPTHTYLFGHDLKVTHNTIADHGLLTLSVMRSNEPLELQCNFMSFFPMNHMPEWKGTGAAACLSRSLVIPFFADLSARDSDNVNFAEATYTSDMLCEFLGEVLALAAYYSTHNLDFSQTMHSQQQGMEETMNSPFIYRDKFSRYFGGFGTMALLYDDYCNWCRDNEYTIVPKKEFKFLWREYTRRSYRPEPLKGGKIVPIKVYAPANGLNGKQPFLASSYFDKLGTTSQLHEMGVSVVGAIEDLFEQATAPTIRLPFDKGENNG